MPLYFSIVLSIVVLFSTYLFAGAPLVMLVFQILVWGSVIFMGLGFGSFATALIYRLPRRIPYAADASGKPVRSMCPPCGRTLTAWELVPVLSWVYQRGRCFCGKQKIPIFYPLVELATGGYVLLFFIWRGFSMFDLPRYGVIAYAVAALVLACQEKRLPPTLLKTILGITGVIVAVDLLGYIMLGGAVQAMLIPWLTLLLLPVALMMADRLPPQTIPQASAALAAMYMVVLILA